MKIENVPKQYFGEKETIRMFTFVQKIGFCKVNKLTNHKFAIIK